MSRGPVSRRLRSVAVAVAALAAALWTASASAQLGLSMPGANGGPARWSGWLQADMAYTWPESGHFSHLRTRAELVGQGSFPNAAKWKLSAQATYDAAYDWSEHYLPGVRHDRRHDLELREAYVDVTGGTWEFRLGKQNIVWGEMVGLFFADVVSAKDLRDFVLAEFDQIRIPQWAARAEWFGDTTHLELIWLPSPKVDRIGEPGDEFYPLPFRFEGLGFQVRGEERPSRKPSNSGVGVRGSLLLDGWDLSAFVYRAPDTQASFYRSVVGGPTPTVVYEPRYDMTTKIGGTLTKDFEGLVLKAELVHTSGRKFSLLELDAGNGLAELDTIDWAAGLDATPFEDWRVNVQFFQRAFLDHDPRIGLDRRENGASLLLAHEMSGRVAAEFLGITSLNRTDRLLRAMLTWRPDSKTRVRAGIDVLAGHPLGLFGRFDDSDRVWAEYRYHF